MKPLLPLFLLCAVSFTTQAQGVPPVPSTPVTATAEAAQAGIRTCLPAIERLESWLSHEQSTNAVAFWDSGAPDKSLFSALVVLEDRTHNSLANLNVVPSSDGQCVVEYTRTGYVAQSCAEHFKSLGSAARFVRDLNSKTALIQGQGVQIFLSPAGQGCLWMRKEVIKQPAASQGKPAQSTPSTSRNTPD